MSYCLNPYCQHPQNPKNARVCRTCGSMLRLKGRYRALRQLGAGGMSRTFLGVDLEQFKRFCVLKQFSPQPFKNTALPKAVELFQQEAMRLHELGSHSQIPAFYGYFEEEQHLYLVQEYVEGENLGQELQEVGYFDEEKIRYFLESLLQILTFIHHHHVIHRDIKPENIIRRKPDQSLVLVDFGVAKQYADIFNPKTGTITGTVGYAPLEQIRGGKAYPASDLYSLGITCIHLLTQVPPNELFDAYTGELDWRSHLPKTHQNLSSQLLNILDKLLKDVVKERYQTAEEVLQDLTSQSIHSPENQAISTSSLSIIVETELAALPNEYQGNAVIFPLTLNPGEQKLTKVSACFNSPDLLTSHPSRQSEFPSEHSPFQTEETHQLSSGFCLPPSSFRLTQNLPISSQIERYKLFKVLEGHTAAVKTLSIGPNGYILVSGSCDRTIRVWNFKTGQLLHKFLGHRADVNAIAISPNGRKLVSGSLDRTILTWNLHTRSMNDQFFSHSGSPYSHRCGPVYAVAYSPDGRIIASGSADASIKLWNQRNGELLYRLGEHSDCVLSLAFAVQDTPSNFTPHPDTDHPQCSWFASGSADGVIKIWQFGTFSSLRTLNAHTDSVHTLAFNPNQQLLASGSSDQTVKLWNFQTEELITTLTGHQDKVLSIAISPDSHLLASGSSDGIVNLWDISNPHTLKIPLQTLQAYHPVAFSPDHQTLVTGGENGQILIWQLSRST